MKTVNILGTVYKIKIHSVKNDEVLSKNQWAGYCCSNIPLIVIADLDDTETFSFINERDKDNYFKECLRHEIMHAFLNESGLQDNFEHANKFGHEETMIDWIALQFPKILKAYQELGCI